MRSLLLIPTIYDTLLVHHVMRIYSLLTVICMWLLGNTGTWHTNTEYAMPGVRHTSRGLKYLFYKNQYNLLS